MLADTIRELKSTKVSLTKKAEELDEIQARFRAVFENAAVGIACVSITGQFLQINQEYCRIIGYTPEEVLSQGFSYQQIMAPGDFETCLAFQRQLLDGVTNQKSRRT